MGMQVPLTADAAANFIAKHKLIVEGVGKFKLEQTAADANLMALEL